MAPKQTLFASFWDYIEKSSLGFSICGFGVFLFLMYFTRMLLDERLLSSILLGAGLAGLLVGVFFWIRRHANNKAAQEREMFLSFKGTENVWRFKVTFNNLIVIVTQFWTLFQLLFFASHTDQNAFPNSHLNFDNYFRFTVLYFEFEYFILFGGAIFIVLLISFFFGFGFLLHRASLLCSRPKGAVKLKNLNKGDDDLEANDRKKRKKHERDGAPKWNSFKRFILQVTSVFYVGIFTQILTALACVWNDSNPPTAYLMRDSSMKCFTGIHAFLATLAILVAFLLFPLNTYILTIGTQPPIKSDNGEIVFIRDATLTFTLAELLCSALKLFYGQPKYRVHYLGMVGAIYFGLIVFMVYGRLTKRPACNSRGMFYMKLAIVTAAFAFNIAGLFAFVKPQYAERAQKGLMYAAWPFIGACFLLWLVTSGRKGYQAFVFSVDVEAVLKNKAVGICLAVDNDHKHPPRYKRMDMMVIFDPRGTPWFGTLLLLALKDKNAVLTAPFDPDHGVDYTQTTIIPKSHLTDPIDMDNFNLDKIANEIFIRYVRKDLRKLIKSVGGDTYNVAKKSLKLDEMFEVCYQQFAKSKDEQRMLKINYPHLAIYMLERFCREQPHENIVILLTTGPSNNSNNNNTKQIENAPSSSK